MASRKWALKLKELDPVRQEREEPDPERQETSEEEKEKVSFSTNLLIINIYFSFTFLCV